MAILHHLKKSGPVGYLARHLAAGLTGGAVFGGLILGFNVGHLGSLIEQSPDGLLYAVLLFFGLFVTFGSVALGVGIMALGEDNET